MYLSLLRESCCFAYLYTLLLTTAVSRSVFSLVVMCCVFVQDYRPFLAGMLL